MFKAAVREYDDRAFNQAPNSRIHRVVPPLLVGIDTETTGFETGGLDQDEPVSYGLVVYRDGKLVDSHHFLAKPEKHSSPGAAETHKLYHDDLERSYGGERLIDKNNNRMHPALHPQVALNKFVSKLADYHKQGAVFVGANHEKFDVPMIGSLYENTQNAPFITSGFNDSRWRSVDVIKHDEAIRPRDNHFSRREPDGSPNKWRDSRSLHSLADGYGVKSGGHTAVDDARASVEVFLRQVELANNRKQFGEHDERGQHFRDRFLESIDRGWQGMRKQSSKFVGDTGVEFVKPNICTGKSDCPTCKYYKKIMLEHSDPEKGDKDHLATVKNMLSAHKEVGKNNNKPAQDALRLINNA